MTKVCRCLVCNHWENRGKMTLCHIDVRPQGFCVATFLWYCQPVRLSFLYHICLQHIYIAHISTDLAPKINRCHSVIDLFSPLPQLPVVQRNGFLYEMFYKCATSRNTEVVIAPGGKFLICLCHVYRLILFPEC